MSQSNPYEPTSHTSPGNVEICKVHVRPIDLMQRGYGIIADQYLLFLGITFVGMIVGSAVPFGLILGPMLVGIYMCYAAYQRGEHVEFAHVFRGFDYFKESFIAYLVLMGFASVVMIPLMIAMFAIIFVPLAMAEQNGGNGGPPPGFPLLFLLVYPLIIVANIVIALPFLFTFQLIADRKLEAIPAVKASVQGVLKNFFGVCWYMIVLTFVSVVLTCMCYVPVILFMPVSFGSVFLLYRQIFPQSPGLQPNQPSPVS